MRTTTARLAQIVGATRNHPSAHQETPPKAPSSIGATQQEPWAVAFALNPKSLSPLELEPLWPIPPTPQH